MRAFEFHGENYRLASSVADALAGVEVPNFRSKVPRTSDETMILELQAGDLRSVALQRVSAFSGIQVPHPQGLVFGPCNKHVAIVLQTGNGLGVPIQHLLLSSISAREDTNRTILSTGNVLVVIELNRRNDALVWGKGSLIDEMASQPVAVGGVLVLPTPPTTNFFLISLFALLFLYSPGPSGLWLVPTRLVQRLPQEIVFRKIIPVLTGLGYMQQILRIQGAEYLDGQLVRQSTHRSHRKISRLS